jgi:hypothetical protein
MNEQNSAKAWFDRFKFRFDPTLLMRTTSRILTLVALVYMNQACDNRHANPGVSAPERATNASLYPVRAWYVDEMVVKAESKTNGFLWQLKIGTSSVSPSGPSPVLSGSLYSDSSNFIRCWQYDPSTYLTVALLDKAGRPIERSAKGKMYEQMASQEEVAKKVEQRKKENRAGKARSDGFTLVSSRNSPCKLFDSDVSIPELFMISEPGDYLLKVQMQLVEELPGSEPLLNFSLLPEITARLTLRSTNGTTASPALQH